MENQEMKKEQLINELNGVITKNYDSSKGYATACENVDSPELKQVFRACSNQRMEFANSLQNEVRKLGGEPSHESSTLGAIHRGWIDVKSALSSDKGASVLEACETGEKTAVKEYDDLMEKNLPSNVSAIIRNQRNEVNDTLQQIKIANK